MGEEAIPKPKAGDENTGGMPSLLTVKACLWRFMPVAFYFVPGVIASLMAHHALPLIVTMPFWLGKVINSSFLLYHVRRGKRLINPLTVSPKKRHLCSTQRFTSRIDVLAIMIVMPGWIAYMVYFTIFHSSSHRYNITWLATLCVFALSPFFNWRRLKWVEEQAWQEAIDLKETVQLPEMIAATQTLPAKQKAWWIANATQEETNSVGQRR